jgi:hypothetical protein
VSATTRVVVDDAQIQALERDPATAAVLVAVGGEIARVGAGMAARKTGAGARSFHAEWNAGTGSAHVSWDDVHFYMYFHEVGATHTPAQPALSLAVDIVSI